MAKAINLRGVDDEMMSKLRERADQNNTSINTAILQTLRDGLGITDTKPRLYHDLDHLAGTWSDTEAAEFDKACADFEKIDKEMWE